MSDLSGQTLLDRYYLREHIGTGGMADVYLAWDSKRSTKMAVKVLRRDLANNPRFFQQFAKEAELLRKLEHPNIVRLYEFEKAGDIVFIIMDWVEGGNLKQVLHERKKPCTLEEVSHILGSVCSALNYAHQNEVFHCDVKPANIMLHADGRVLLTDFGVAHLADQRGYGGTPPYMAPEQFNKGTIDARTDVYALGVTLYEILSGGILPFRGDSPNSKGSTDRERIAWEHQNMVIPPLRQYQPRLPEAVEQVVLTAMNKDPEVRFSTTMALRESFEHACAISGREVGSSSSTRTIMEDLSSVASAAAAVAQEAASRAAARAADAAQSFSAQMQQPPSRPARAPRELRERTFAQPAGRGPYLYGRSGQWKDQMLPIPPEGLSLGRSSQCHIQLPESCISRVHATILSTRRGIYIRDENSKLGTFVNGQRIFGPVLLKRGDVIQIGYYQVFEFFKK